MPYSILLLFMLCYSTLALDTPHKQSITCHRFFMLKYPIHLNKKDTVWMPQAKSLKLF
jgi:hypothetical protein